MPRRSNLTPRGNAKQTEIAHRLGLHCYPWPKLCGDDEANWQAIRDLIDGAARHEHQRECGGGFMADGRTRQVAEPFAGDHAWRHKHRMELALVAFVAAGLNPLEA